MEKEKSDARHLLTPPLLLPLSSSQPQLYLSLYILDVVEVVVVVVAIKINNDAKEIETLRTKF